MSDWRKTQRAAVRAALKGDARFAGFTEISVNAKSLDAGSLPAMAVGTPSETSSRDGLDSTERDTRLIVVVKRLGADDFALEDTCDDDAQEIEKLTGAALDAAGFQWDLTETRYEADSGGGQSVGTLMMAFSVKFWPVDPVEDDI